MSETHIYIHRKPAPVKDIVKPALVPAAVVETPIPTCKCGGQHV
jgi:hypothetical protein